MHRIALFTLIVGTIACNSKTDNPIKNAVNRSVQNIDSLKIVEFYKANNVDSSESKTLGSVSNGMLEHGKVMPYFGSNFTYFDKDSYFAKRAFTSDKVKAIILDAYDSLSVVKPKRHFYLMELSNEHGGKLFPHRTHQNGLSADFMMPKLKNGEDYYGLDTLGKNHYWLSFDENGKYNEDNSIEIDFNLIAQHILILENMARKREMKISKVIIKIEFKDELFATEYGRKLKESGIYVVQNLSKQVNDIHDEHFHIDFEKI